MVDEPFGPFAVSPVSISRLGRDFAAFVNELLRVEAADALIAGGSLITTGLENIGDGGVDAFLDSAMATSRLPRGTSAWQFKAGDLPPAKCTEELRGAGHALEILRAGGKYRLVVGADINPKQVARRRRALEDEATAQKIFVDPDAIRVFNASDLAAWTAEHPSLAVSALVGGIARVAVNFTDWSRATGLSETWVVNKSADAVAAAVDTLVTGSAFVALHIQGFSGLGKTRSVMESLRGKPCEPLVAYVHAADALPPGLFYRLQEQRRHTVLVIDECDARSHELLEQQIPASSKTRLITIGTPSGYRPKAEVHEIGHIDDHAMREILHLNEAALPREASRVIVGAAAGNVKLALLLAKDLVHRPVLAASDLITLEIIKSYVTRSLPTGRGMLACAALALFTSIGFDGDVAGELRAVAGGLGFGVLDLKAAAEDLNHDGLLSRLGRFRAVTPHPLAIYLAARGWEQFGDQIAVDLLPCLGYSMTMRLLERATDIGESGAVRRVITQLLGPGGLFEHVGTAHDDQGGVLMYLAMLAPQEIAGRLATTLASLTDEERQAMASKRPEVARTLEKLAWHTATFRQAADGLLSLAVAAQDASRPVRPGIWTGLFGAMLPATSAAPAMRIEYLAETARNPDGHVRRLAVTAAARACPTRELGTVSAELQGGFVVAPRGTPATYGEAWNYSGAAMDILADLANDHDPQISGEAASALAETIHPCLENEPLREHLAGAIARLPADGLTKARTEIEHLRALFERVRSNSDVAGREAGLEALFSKLPAASAEQDFDALANADRWDFGHGNELQQRLNDAALAIPADRRTAHILKAITVRPAAAFELGKVLSTVAADDNEVLEQIVAQAAAGNVEPIAGFLLDHVDKGLPAAFDDLLESSRSAPLDDAARLAISVRGPQTSRGWRRVEHLVQGMSPWHGTKGTSRLAYRARPSAAPAVPFRLDEPAGKSGRLQRDRGLYRPSAASAAALGS